MSQRDLSLGDRYVASQPRQSQLISSQQHRSGGYRTSSSSSQYDDALQMPSGPGYQSGSGYQTMIHHPHHHHHPNASAAAASTTIYTPHYSHHHPQLSIIPLQQRWTQQPPSLPSSRPSAKQSYAGNSRSIGEAVGLSTTPQQPTLYSSSTVIRGSLAQGSRTRDARGSSSKPSSSGTVKKPAVSVTKTITSPRAAKTPVDTTLPALVPSPPPPVDPDHDSMMSGLKLQLQEWLEKAELKRVCSDLARLVNCLQTPPNSTTKTAKRDSSNSVAGTTEGQISNELTSLTVSSIKQHIQLLKLRVQAKVHSIETMSKDIEGLSQEVSNHQRKLVKLQQGELANVTSKLARAKRKGRFHSEFEQLATECLKKKHRHEYASEQAKEQEKLTEVQKATALWKEIGEFRNRQVEVTLSHFKEFLESLRSPESVIKLLQQSKAKEANIVVIDDSEPAVEATGIPEPKSSEAMELDTGVCSQTV